jgi:hypothetical protein
LNGADPHLACERPRDPATRLVAVRDEFTIFSLTCIHNLCKTLLRHFRWVRADVVCRLRDAESVCGRICGIGGGAGGVVGDGVVIVIILFSFLCT